MVDRNRGIAGAILFAFVACGAIAFLLWVGVSVIDFRPIPPGMIDVKAYRPDHVRWAEFWGQALWWAAGILACMSGFVGAWIATDKRPDTDERWLVAVGGFLAGAVAGPLGVIALLLVPRTAKREVQRKIAMERVLQELRAAKKP